MERMIYEAAIEGCVKSLLNLLHEDALALDRILVSCYSETPLHIASMLGHVDFMHEILKLKPELAGVLDSRKSSPLHLATAKGDIDMVKKLVSVNPDMCFVCDRDGRNPLHIAAIKGHLNILRELVQVKPQAARILMERSETILHACVYYNQLEGIKLLVERMNDCEFVNSKDDDGNTILHLAVMDKQVEAVKFLTSSTTIEVDAVNVNGFTALDILTHRKFDLKDWKMGELLGGVGATSLKNTPLLKHEPAGTTEAGSVLTSHDNNQGRERPEKVPKEQADDWLEKKRDALMVVASLIATMAFQAGLNPPGGVWQDTSPEGNSTSEPHRAGYPIMDTKNTGLYNRFFLSNTVGFVASLSIILLLISGLPCFKRKFFIWTLMVIMWVAITATALAYFFSIGSLSTGVVTFSGCMYVVLAWFGLTVILILGHIIRLLVKMIKCIIKLRKRRKEPSSSVSREALHTV